MKRRAMIKNLSAIPVAGGLYSLDSIINDPFYAGKLNTDTQLPGSGEAGALSIGPDILRSIGVEPVINCRGTFTAIGGSTELPEVRRAMEFAAVSYVQLDELAMAVGRRLGEITGAEWGMVSSGCAAGLKHVTAACITGGDPEKLIRIPDLTGFEKTEVIIPGYSRIFYDHAIRNTGARIITVDTPEELSSAINSRTAMIFLFTGSSRYYEGPLSIENVTAIARRSNIPVIADAAAEILTIPNIHLQKGATIVAYSGGKAIRGPQSAGLLLGKKEILLSAWQASSPHHGPGRDNKVDSEEQIGMLAAVETWVSTDHKAKEEAWLSWLKYISEQISGIKSVRIEIREPEGVDNRSASMTIMWDPGVLNITGEQVAEDFAKNKPRIAIGCRSDLSAGTTSISVNAQMMQPGEEKTVAERIRNILKQKHTPLIHDMEKPSADITGRWDVNIKFFNSEARHELLLDKQDGNWIQGIHLSGFSRQEIAGTIEGNKVKLQSAYIAPGDSIPFIFAGEMTNNAISGTLYMGEYRTAEFTATKKDIRKRQSRISIPNYGRRNPNSW